MALKKKPVTGMKDILPAEMQVREYVMNQIRETYGGFGFHSIETPCVEHIENLTSKQGGDNEKLIFKIMKRGEKLNLESAQAENDLVDSGLRYDLTVPLSRYYSNNAASLPAPFKSLQMGSVWRSDSLSSATLTYWEIPPGLRKRNSSWQLQPCLERSALKDIP